VSATKSATGHTLGAATSLKAVICAHALKGQWIHPNLNNLGRDGDCADIKISKPTALKVNYSAIISNSFAFGGLNAALVFGAA
jgi:3-oxoacyl-(acyl-carrier-protein) synthase